MKYKSFTCSEYTHARTLLLLFLCSAIYLYVWVSKLRSAGLSQLLKKVQAGPLTFIVTG